MHELANGGQLERLGNSRVHRLINKYQRSNHHKWRTEWNRCDVFLDRQSGCRSGIRNGPDPFVSLTWHVYSARFNGQRTAWGENKSTYGGVCLPARVCSDRAVGCAIWIVSSTLSNGNPVPRRSGSIPSCILCYRCLRHRGQLGRSNR